MNIIDQKRDCYHLPNKRLSKKRKFNEFHRERFFTAAWQICSVLIISTMAACVSVYIGNTYNFYDLSSDFTAWYGTKDVEEAVPENSILRRRLTLEKFETVFQNRRVVSFPSALTQSARDELWRLLIEEYGDASLPVGHVASQTVGDQSPLYEMTLSDYINNHKFSKEKPHYVFDNQLLNRLPLIKDMIDKTPHILRREKSVEAKEIFLDFNAPPILTIGKNGSGLAFHQHRRSWNDLYVGEKLWSVYPPFNLPQRGFNPWDPHIKWLEQEQGQLKGNRKPITFVQRAGEVVYIPEGWYHATMSIGVTVSVAQQPLEPLQDTPYYYLVHGDVKMQRRAYTEALELFNSGLKLSGDKDFNLMRKAGEASEKIGLLEQAELFYRNAISLNLLHPAAYIELMGMLHEGGKIEPALVALDLARRRGVHHEVLDYYHQVFRKEENRVQSERVKHEKDTCPDVQYDLSRLLSEL